MNEIILQCKNLQVAYDKGVIMDNLSFELKSGETAILMGKSACGKTSFLKAICGIIPYKGEIKYKGRIMMMFQRPCVLPHKTAKSNIDYVTRLCGAKKQFVDELIERIEIKDLLEQYPHQLSGGELQRLSLLICLLVQPSILLLDEPFSALDYTTRYNIINVLRDIKERVGLSFLIVTHTIDNIDIIGERFWYMDGNPAGLESFATITELRNKMQKNIKENS